MKRLLDIRDRVLLAALLPTLLVSLLLASVFLLERVVSLNEAHVLRSQALARHLASASEYGLQMANRRILQPVVEAAAQEVDLRSIRILDARGRVIAQVGQPVSVLPEPEALAQGSQPAQGGYDILIEPVVAHPWPGMVEEGALPAPLGYVVLELSRRSVVSAERDMLLAGMGVTLLGLLFGSLLALRISRGVIEPVQRVSDLAERLGRGELSARADELAANPLQSLQNSLNLMAQRLQQGRDELEQRVAQATLALREKKEEAEAATQEKTRFLAAATHDLRQPTHALGLLVARLSQLPHDPQARHLIVQLEAAVRSTQRLLDALLDLSQLESHGEPVQHVPFALADLLDALRLNFAPEALEQGLQLRVRPTPHGVRSDPVLLYRILLNLVSNALRHTRSGGVLVACRLRRQDRAVRIEVWDSGVGIAPEHQGDIFKEFFQIGNPERDRHKGLGLGLTIVQRTAHQLGHRLDLCSVPGQGSRFSLELPWVPAQALSAQPTRLEHGEREPLRGVRVLVIEDDQAAAQATHSLLQGWGCAVALAQDETEALAQLAHVTPQVVLSDYRLRAGRNGLQAVAALRQVLGADLPACLISGDVSAELRQQCHAEGLRLLFKPVQPAKLRALLHRMAASQGRSNRQTVPE